MPAPQLGPFRSYVKHFLTMPRRAVVRQKQAMDTQREAVELQKQAIAESLDLNRKQVQNQERIISLLEQIRDKKTP
jgi:hypothetical protein